MFTGIISNLGTVQSFKVSPKKSELWILKLKTKTQFTKIKLGESIAVNGCCLTVTSSKDKTLTFDVSDETLRKTTFQTLKKGMRVNLERAMKASDRFGGHFVSGHVDSTGTIKAIKEEPGSVLYTVSFPKSFRKLLIEKGSVTINGISLTVCDLKASQFNVYIIPHTLKETNLGELKKGDLVNLEYDLLGKYVLNSKQ